MTIEELKKELDLGVRVMPMNREVKEIASMIKSDEIIGTGTTTKYGNSMGVLVATNKRVIYVSKVLFNITIEEFYYNKISSVQYKNTLTSGELEMFFSGTWFRFHFHTLTKPQGQKLANYIKEQINDLTNTLSKPVINQTTIVTQLDPIDQLEKLAHLKEKGIISEEEFNAKKKQILGL